jgi:hypothetical protein
MVLQGVNSEIDVRTEKFPMRLKTDGYHALAVLFLATAELGNCEKGQMLKITRTTNGEVVIKLSGRMDAENLDELETLMNSERDGRRIGLDLKDLTLVDQDAVSFLKRCEADNITLRNCPAYIREWITRERKPREM